MKISVTVLCVFINILIKSEGAQSTSYPRNTAYGYFKNIGIPEAKRLQKSAEDREHNSLLRIFGGEEATLGEFIYQAALIISLFDEDANGVCGGSLISEQRVLTAAHCWNDGFHQGYYMQVVLGTTNVYSEDGVRQGTYAVRMYPGYSPPTARNDIAMVVLPQRVTYTDNIGPIALPSGTDLEQNYVGYNVVASGFGRQTADTSVPVPYDLKKVNLTVITNEECADLLERTIQSTVLCAIGLNGANVCEGDSGGPLVSNGSTNARTLMALTSHSIINDDGCESGLPTVFTRISPYIDWIIEFM